MPAKSSLYCAMRFLYGWYFLTSSFYSCTLASAQDGVFDGTNQVGEVTRLPSYGRVSTLAEKYTVLLERTILLGGFPANMNGSVKLEKALRYQFPEILQKGFDPRLFFELLDGSLVPSMSRQHCYALFLTGLACTKEELFVEFGTWSGASTRCVAMGMSFSGCVAEFQVLDAFVPSQLWKLKGSRFGRIRAVDMLSIWKEVVWEVNKDVQPIVGWIDAKTTKTLAPSWKNRGIDAFMIDSAKTHDQLVKQTIHIWDNLKVGAVLHLMDFIKTPQVELVYFVLKPHGYLRLVYLACCGSPWTFVVERPIEWSIIKNFSMKQVPCSSVARTFVSIQEDIKNLAFQMNAEPKPVQCSLRMLEKRQRVAEKSCLP